MNVELLQNSSTIQHFDNQNRMSRHLLAGILFLSLSVLTFVQFRLLLAGVHLEKQRFDQRTEAALLAVADSLNQPGPRSTALIDHKTGKVTTTFPDVRIVTDAPN